MKVELHYECSSFNNDLKKNVFASDEYLRVCSPTYGWFKSDAFILPFYIDKIFIFKRMIFTCSIISRVEGNESNHEHKEFLDRIVEISREKKVCDFISKAQSNAVFDVVPDGSVACRWGTYIREISFNDDVLLKSFHSKHRNVINRAIREGVAVKEIGDLNAVYDCIKGTLVRQGLPYYPSLQFLKQLENSLAGNVLLLGAYAGDALQGVAVIPYDKTCGYYLYGGSVPDSVNGALNLLQFEAMRILRDRGVRMYDFVGARLKVEEGSKYEGIQRFKERFGTSVKEGFAFRVVLSRWKWGLFNFMIAQYFRVKGKVYIDPIDSMKEE